MSKRDDKLPFWPLALAAWFHIAAMISMPFALVALVHGVGELNIPEFAASLAGVSFVASLMFAGFVRMLPVPPADEVSEPTYRATKEGS